MHTVGTADLRALATGLGGPDAVRQLMAGQDSRRLGWIWLLLDAAGPDERAATRSLILAAARQAPEAVRDLLTHPLVGAWTVHARSRAAEPAELAALGLSAARLAGLTAEARLPAVHGVVPLPGAGVVRTSATRPMISTVSGRLRVDGVEARPGRDWLTARTVTLTGPPALALTVEDVDPCRDMYRLAPTGRLTSTELREWRAGLDAGWRLLTRCAPHRAAEVVAGLTGIVPLAKEDDRIAHSVTSTRAVGLIALDRPTDPAATAVTLVHELQHSKLAALHTITPLWQPDDHSEYRVPWRSDPRPLAGALQGLYAFLGVADMWRCLIPEVGPRAEAKFAEARAFIREPAEQLSRSPRLTEAGRDFTAALAVAVRRLRDEPLPDAAAAAGERSLAGHRSRWIP